MEELNQLPKSSTALRRIYYKMTSNKATIPIEETWKFDFRQDTANNFILAKWRENAVLSSVIATALNHSEVQHGGQQRTRSN